MSTSPPAPATDPPGWPLWIAPLGVLLGLVIGILASIIVERGQTHPGPTATIAADIVFDLGFVAAALWLVWRQGGLRAADFGYRRVRPSTAIRSFALAAIAYYGLTAVYATVLQLKGSDKLPSDLGTTKSTAALVAASVFVCAIAPMAEELFFRGFIFGTLRGMRVRLRGHELGPWIAAVLTGILFGLAHTGSASSQYLIPLGFLGFVLCLLRWRTGSLYPCMALHSANNALALGYNQLGWNAPEIVGLIAASWLVIAVVTGPLAKPALSPAHGVG
jgi:membrane protease YdiL (CAAX protease family)